MSPNAKKALKELGMAILSVVSIGIVVGLIIVIVQTPA